MSESSPSAQVVARWCAGLAGGVVTLFGLVALVGWILDSPTLRGAGFDGLTVKTNAALGLLLAGLCLIGAALRQLPVIFGRAVPVLAAGASAIGLLTLVQYLATVDLGIDQFLFHEPPGWTGTSAPNRMGPPAALALALSGLAIVLVDKRTRRDGSPSQYLGAGIFLIGLLPVLGYLYGSQRLYAWAGITNTALHAAVALVVLGLGILFVRPDRGLTSRLLAPDGGGMLLRRLILPSILVPILLGWFRVHGEQWGWWDATLGTSLMTSVMIVTFVALLLQSAGTMARLETVRRQNLEALRHSEQRFRQLVAVLPAAMYTCNAEGVITFYNGQAAALWGRSPQTGDTDERFCGAFRLFRPDGSPLPRNQTPMALAAGQGRSSRNAEVTIERPDGSRISVLVNVDPIRDAAGKVLGAINVFLDNTDRKQAEAELQALNKTLEHRIADRTVELKQRAAQLQGLAAQLAQAEERERRRLAQLLHDGLQQVLVAAKMKISFLRRASEARTIETAEQAMALLDEAINQSRSLTADLSPTVLYTSGLTAALEWLGRQTQEKHFLEVEIAADPAAEPQDEAVRVFLFQAVRELLFNVVKHAQSPRARIELARRDGDRLQLVVSDSGKGFDGSPDTRGSSSGFGLLSIRERLELIGGRLEIRSSPGQGTEMVIEVPGGGPVPLSRPEVVREPAAISAGRTIEVVRALRSEGNVRILLADDHLVLRQGLAGLLREQAGFDVVAEASDGRQAVEAAIETQPDVVLMDVTMPGMNGIEATRRILEALPHVRVIGLSMHEEPDVARAMREAGAVAYVRKDTASEQLISLILCQGAAMRSVCEEC